jgi:hypothetical protein
MFLLLFLVSVVAVVAPSVVLFLLRERYAVLVVFGVEVVVLALVTWQLWPRPISACPQGACDGQMISWLLVVPIALAWIATVISAVVRFLMLRD